MKKLIKWSIIAVLVFALFPLVVIAIGPIFMYKAWKAGNQKRLKIFGAATGVLYLLFIVTALTDSTPTNDNSTQATSVSTQSQKVTDPTTPSPEPQVQVKEEQVVLGTADITTPEPTQQPIATASTHAPTPTVGGTSGAHSCTGPDLDCSDFANHTEAQSFFDGCGFTATNDPMKLDGRGNTVDDGIACESL